MVVNQLCIGLFYPTLTYSCPTIPYPTLPYPPTLLAYQCPTMPYLTQPYPTLPHPPYPPSLPMPYPILPYTMNYPPLPSYPTYLDLPYLPFPSLLLPQRDKRGVFESYRCLSDMAFPMWIDFPTTLTEKVPIFEDPPSPHPSEEGSDLAECLLHSQGTCMFVSCQRQRH